MLSFPYAEGTLPQKLGRGCCHCPMSLLLPRQKEKKNPQKNLEQRFGAFHKVAPFLHAPGDLPGTVAGYIAGFWPGRIMVQGVPMPHLWCSQ